MMILLTVATLLAAGGDDVLLADFEGKDYGAWTVTGTAFGSGPARGTLPGQMPVSGFLGKALVNSYHGGDRAEGTLTSPPFRIERKAINFLIGGGRHPNETCINLLLDGAIVRSSTGRDSEHLEWDSWDVSEYSGKTATIEIVDRHQGGWGHLNIDQILQSDLSLKAERHTRDLAIEAKYLHLPVRTGAPKRRLKVLVGERLEKEFEIELAARDPQFWAVLDLSEWKGKTARLEVWGPPDTQEALDAVGQGDDLKGPELYREPLRPQFHFTARRGWLNDPNGMVVYKGEYHLYYQHNPYGWGWGNMHWGHAVSRDLLHWEELPIALTPVAYGDWAFSGSAVVDAANSAGFKTGDEDVLVGAYTSTGRGECIVYSNDRGRTWKEYAGNPVVKHPGRDPRLLWYAPGSVWVMAVYDEADHKQRIAFHTSKDLKTWTFQSAIDGYYECPDLFELAVDGDASKARWVLLAADGRYQLGSFDGRAFVPDGDKRTLWHGNFYAAQTFSNAPGGRRIQIGWARGTDFPGMPFNQQMNVPVDLTLKSTADGPRMAARPVPELETLRRGKRSWKDVSLQAGSDPLVLGDVDLLDLELAFRPGTAERVTLEIRGTSLVYDVRKAELSSKGVRVPLPGSGEVVRLRVLVDRGSVEVFGGDGLAALCVAAIRSQEQSSLRLSAAGGAATLESAEAWGLAPCWR